MRISKWKKNKHGGEKKSRRAVEDIILDHFNKMVYLITVK